jgi:hypothetical protein
MKMLALALLNQDGNKVLVGLDLGALATTHMHLEYTCWLTVGCVLYEDANSENSSTSNTCCLSAGCVCENANP